MGSDTETESAHESDRIALQRQYYNIGIYAYIRMHNSCGVLFILHSKNRTFVKAYTDEYYKNHFLIATHTLSPYYRCSVGEMRSRFACRRIARSPSILPATEDVIAVHSCTPTVSCIVDTSDERNRAGAAQLLRKIQTSNVLAKITCRS